MKNNIKLMYTINLLSELKLYGAIVLLFYIQLTNSTAAGMSIFSIATIVSSLSEFPTGVISDKIGRRNTVILGSFFGLLNVLFLTISKNYLLLIISAIFNGIEIAFFSGNNQALIYDNLREMSLEEDFGVYIGKFNSMIYLAGATSALIGGIIWSLTSIRIVLIISIIPKIVQLFLSFKIKDIEISKNKEKTFEQIKNVLKSVYSNKLLQKQIIADGINDGVGEACFQFRTVFYELVWPSWALGLPNLLSNIGAFFSNWFGGKIEKRFGKKKVYIFSNVYSIISNSIGVSIKNSFSPIIMVSNSLFSTEVIQIDIEHKLYDNKYRASMSSLKSLVKNLIFAVMAILLGILADVLGVVVAFIIFQLLKIISILIYINLLKKINISK